MTAGLFCKDFTFFDFRGIKTCFLLKGCTDKRPKCTVPSACVSGRSSACGKYCPRLAHHEDDHLAWRCQGGINPYKENIPAGTPCYAKWVLWLRLLQSSILKSESLYNILWHYIWPCIWHLFSCGGWLDKERNETFTMKSVCVGKPGKKCIVYSI